MPRLQGGCSCNSVRFTLKQPLFVLACHCNACKKRTGSAYGISIAVDNEGIEKFIGPTTTFTRVGDSGQKVEYDFCSHCGTTIRWRVARMPNRVVFAGGTLDDMTQVTIGGEMYTKDALPWARLGCEISCLDAPDEAFRTELAQRAALDPA